MSRNGSGTQTSPASSFPAVANTLIESTKFNNVINDINASLTASIANDGQTPILANLPMSGFKHTGVAAASTSGEYAEYAQMNTAISAVSTPAGAVLHFAMSTAPSGWLKADGSAVSRTTYATLFAAISTTFGVGDGSTTFNLPDLRGEFIRGFDDGRLVDSGRVFGSAQADELKAHTHIYLQNAAGNNVVGGPSPILDGETVSNTGSTGGTETRPRNIALLACIKY